MGVHLKNGGRDKEKGALRKEGARVREKTRRYLIVNSLAVQVDVETFDFNFRRDAQADDQVKGLQDDESDDGAIDEHSTDVLELRNQLVEVDNKVITELFLILNNFFHK